MGGRCQICTIVLLSLFCGLLTGCNEAQQAEVATQIAQGVETAAAEGQSALATQVAEAAKTAAAKAKSAAETQIASSKTAVASKKNPRACGCLEYLSFVKWEDKEPGKDYEKLPQAKDLLHNTAAMQLRGFRRADRPEKGAVVIFDHGASFEFVVGDSSSTASIPDKAGHAGYVRYELADDGTVATVTLRHANWDMADGECRSPGCFSDGGCDNVRHSMIRVKYPNDQITFWVPSGDQ